MAEYIDREKAIELIDEIFDKTDPEGAEQIVVLKCRKAVRELPTATDIRETKHSEWLPDYEAFTDWNGYESEPIQTGWVCSVCGRQEPRKEPYCHCGALMDNYEDEKKGEDNVQV